MEDTAATLDEQTFEAAGTQPHPEAMQARAPINGMEDADDDFVLAMLEQNPHLPADEVRNLCLQTKLDYLISDKNALLAELESVENLKLAAEGCKDRDLAAVLKLESGEDLDELLDEKVAALVWKYSNRTSLPNLVRTATEFGSHNQDHDDDD